MVHGRVSSSFIDFRRGPQQKWKLKYDVQVGQRVRLGEGAPERKKVKHVLAHGAIGKVVKVVREKDKDVYYKVTNLDESDFDFYNETELQGREVPGGAT